MPKVKTGRRWEKRNFNYGRKKHVETMFITNKQKKHPYYFKPANVKDLWERSPSRLLLARGITYVRTLESGYLTIGPLKAIVRLYKWFIKYYKLEEGFRYRLYCFPDFVLTSKPKEVRMGKGKGAPSHKVALIKKGQVLFSLSFTQPRERHILAGILLKKIIHKLPFRVVVTTNPW